MALPTNSESARSDENSLSYENNNNADDVIEMFIKFR
jgi:hypothetical protein